MSAQLQASKPAPQTVLNNRVKLRTLVRASPGKYSEKKDERKRHNRHSGSNNSNSNEVIVAQQQKDFQALTASLKGQQMIRHHSAISKGALARVAMLASSSTVAVTAPTQSNFCSNRPHVFRKFLLPLVFIASVFVFSSALAQS